MSFQRHSSFQNHLDCENHKHALERETLFDKAIMMYASKLEQGATCDVSQIWALKSAKEYK